MHSTESSAVYGRKTALSGFNPSWLLEMALVAALAISVPASADTDSHRLWGTANHMVTAPAAFLLTATPSPTELPASVLKLARPMTNLPASTAASTGHKAYGGKHGGGGSGDSAAGVPGITSIQNWTGQFTEPGYDNYGNPQSVWPYAIVGQPPEKGGTTTIHAPLIPVIVDLLDANGNVATSSQGVPLTFDPTQVVKPVLDSPVFQPWPYYSGFTQFVDGLQRAEFWDRLRDDDKGQDCEDGWHTLFEPHRKPTQRMQIPYGSWYVVLNADGSCCTAALVDVEAFLVQLYPSTVPQTLGTVIGYAELTGAMTTKDMTTFLFNDVYLYGGNVSNCCYLGFHDVDLEADAQGNFTLWYVFSYASWIGNTFFTGGFQDITALNHELSEATNDPFVQIIPYNWTPWYLSPSGLCQNNLESGDAIEGLNTTPTFALQMNGRTYHPQNMAMFPWFAFESPSPALKHTYSFPDETTLTTLSPPNLLPNCVPGP